MFKLIKLNFRIVWLSLIISILLILAPIGFSNQNSPALLFLEQYEEIDNHKQDKQSSEPLQSVPVKPSTLSLSQRALHWQITYQEGDLLFRTLSRYLKEQLIYLVFESPIDCQINYPLKYQATDLTGLLEEIMRDFPFSADYYRQNRVLVVKANISERVCI